MSDLIDGKIHLTRPVHSWIRYRAHLHCIDIKRGPVIVPLNRINSQFEYLEEVRFEKFRIIDTKADVSGEKVGLLNYITNYWNIKYDTALSVNDIHIGHELFKETGLCPIPIQRQERHYGVFGDHFIKWSDYFPHYVVNGFTINGVKKIYNSPYPDEIDSHSGFDIEFLPPYSAGGRPRIKIVSKV